MNASQSFFMAQQDSIVHKYHIFPVHLPFDGHTHCFQGLALINCAAINGCASIPRMISTLLGRYLEGR